MIDITNCPISSLKRKLKEISFNINSNYFSVTYDIVYFNPITDEEIGINKFTSRNINPLTGNYNFYENTSVELIANNTTFVDPLTGDYRVGSPQPGDITEYQFLLNIISSPALQIAMGLDLEILKNMSVQKAIDFGRFE